METIRKSELFAKLGVFQGVKNLSSPRSWEPVPNQYSIQYENGRVFQSYETLIAVRCGGRLYLTKKHDCTKTTSKYCNQWTGYNTKERREGLEDGKFTLIVD